MARWGEPGPHRSLTDPGANSDTRTTQTPRVRCRQADRVALVPTQPQTPTATRRCGTTARCCSVPSYGEGDTRMSPVDAPVEPRPPATVGTVPTAEGQGDRSAVGFRDVAGLTKHRPRR